MSMRSEVDIVLDMNHPISLDDYSEDGQWNIKDTEANNGDKSYNVSIIKLAITLTRRRVFYLLTIILPIFFLSLTASLIFALPPDEGEKTGTGITVLLSFAVYLTVVAGLVPNTSLQSSMSSYFISCASVFPKTALRRKEISFHFWPYYV